MNECKLRTVLEAISFNDFDGLVNDIRHVDLDTISN